MGEILIANKGHQEMYLTRYYNPASIFNIDKDNVGFNNDVNPFSQYCSNSPCVTPINDKIKIISLPDKGRLFYLTNIGSSNPIYEDVYIGQTLLVNDLINFKILRFNAEGSFNNQFTGNYFTNFNIERFCGDISNNIITTINLNLLETEVKLDNIPNIIITIYKADSGSHYIGQVKFYGLQASVVDGSNITKVELFCRFRSIGLNQYWQTTETHIVTPPTPSINVSRQFVYGFKDPSKYIASRDWNGADNASAQIKIYTSAGEIKIFNVSNISFPWYNSYPSSITF